MMNRLDVLLINPGNRSDIYQQLGLEFSAIEPPVWAGLMATFALKKGYSVDILDASALAMGPQEVAKKVAEINPVVAAVIVYGHQPSASTQNMPASGAICRELRASCTGVKTILIGGHVAALPERTMNEEEVDFAASGEGPYTLIRLIDALKSGTPLSNVPGLWYWDHEMLKNNPAPPLIQNLDEEMPGIAWDLLPMNQYRAHNWHCFDGLVRQPYAAIYTTLGCPYHCSFCCIQAPFKDGERQLGFKESVNSYRFWSPERIAAEIDFLVNRYGVRNIKFADELFVLNSRHVLALCDLLIKRNYNLNIWAYARVDSIKEGMLEKLKAAGVNWLALGIEAASEDVRSNVDKGYSQKLIFETVRKIREAGIYIIGNYIFGLPEDTVESMQATLDLALELKCEFANFYSTMAYPGSALYETAMREQWPLPKTWLGYSQHAAETLPLPTRFLSADEVLAFRDKAFQIYFSDPGYLNHVRQTFGSPTVQHIERMTGHRLKRDLLAEKSI